MSTTNRSSNGMYITKDWLIGILVAVGLSIMGFYMSNHAAEHTRAITVMEVERTRVDNKLTSLELVVYESKAVIAGQAATLNGIQASLIRIEKIMDSRWP